MATSKRTRSALLRHVRRGRATAARQRELEQELALARDIQQGLLLAAVPQLHGWELTALSLPARQLGGDLYDFMPLPDGTCGIMIGDVSGKGLPAALRMAVARTIFRYAARNGASPGTVLAETNRAVLREIPHGMVTMLYAAVDLHSGECRVANAGHTYPLVANGNVREVELTGLPLGVDDEGTYNECMVMLAPGETLLLCTDGVVEAEDAHGAQYGDARLVHLLHTHAEARPRTLAAALLAELRTWSAGQQTDDITLVILRRRHAQLGAELRTVTADLIGFERAATLWQAVAVPPESSDDAWLALVPEIHRYVQEQSGRGPARELSTALRQVIEEYREGRTALREDGIDGNL